MLTKNQKLLCFTVACLGVFLATFNETFLNAALNQITIDTGCNAVWLVTAYMLGAGVMVPVSAFLYRKLPTKILYMVTISFFIVGSILGGLSGNNFVLALIARVIQSIGSGLIVPLNMNIVLEVAPRNKLGSFLGVTAVMATLGPSVGILLSGVFMTVIGDWHALFWIFGVLISICFIFGSITIKNLAKLTKPKLDVLSVALISVGLLGIMFGLAYLFTAWWIALICIVLGICALALFIVRQNKLSSPLIKVSLFKSKYFSLGIGSSFCATTLTFACNIIVISYLISKGNSSLISSLALFPAIIISCVTASIAGKIFDKHGVKFLLPIGFAMMTVFTVLLAVLAPVVPWYGIALLYIPIIAGSSLCTGPGQSFGLSFLKPDDNPHGVTLYSTIFQIAGAFGSAFLADGLYHFIESSNSSVDSALFVTGIASGIIAFIGLILGLFAGKYKKDKKDEDKEKEENPSTPKVMGEIKFTINKNDSILDAMKVMVDNNVSGVVVVDNNKKLFGYLSDGDLIRYLAKNYSDIKNIYSYTFVDGEKNKFKTKVEELSTLKVCDIVTTSPITISVDEDLGDVCKTMGEKHIKKAPVVKDDDLVGIIDRKDITRYVMNKCLELQQKKK
jgi:MFS transporter, DHA2 family, lincomycin resistance protein